MNTIRSGQHEYKYHERDVRPGLRALVQDTVRAAASISDSVSWVAYHWTNPPNGAVLIVPEVPVMTEAAALAWLRAQV